MNCLWISRDLPFPLDAGDRIYSANMARSLAEAGARVRFMAFGDPAAVPSDWPVQAQVIAGRKQGKLRALASPLPIAAAIHATPEYRAALAAALREAWDVIVFDSYGSGWALEACMQAYASKPRRPQFVYLSHNHEETLWRAMVRDSQAGWAKKLALWQNALKVCRLERRLVGVADMVTAISAEDHQRYQTQAPGRRGMVLTPGYGGWVAPTREITDACPVRLVLVGSFRWVVKQENLRQFLALADEPFHANGIQFDVIGDVPQELLEELTPSLKATYFHGFVDDVAPYFRTARMAVVPELIGGGFKLKYLDYLFGRVPIATVADAAAGLPDTIRRNMLCSGNLQQLVEGIVATIGQAARLNTMQRNAFAEANSLFRWQDRGLQFRRALEVA